MGSGRMTGLLSRSRARGRAVIIEHGVPGACALGGPGPGGGSVPRFGNVRDLSGTRIAGGSAVDRDGDVVEEILAQAFGTGGGGFLAAVFDQPLQQADHAV